MLQLEINNSLIENLETVPNLLPIKLKYILYSMFAEDKK